jgi:hypothetical protein
MHSLGITGAKFLNIFEHAFSTCFSIHFSTTRFGMFMPNLSTGRPVRGSILMATTSGEEAPWLRPFVPTDKRLSAKWTMLFSQRSSRALNSWKSAENYVTKI